MKPSCTSTTGTASDTVARSSVCASLPLKRMRSGLMVIAGLLPAVLATTRAARAQSAHSAQREGSVSVMAQAIPLVTSAHPTATRGNVTEAYLSQPVLMAHAGLRGWYAAGTLNLEGLTLDRGELSTGGYGEGYVDRRHPHAYIHELLGGFAISPAHEWAASITAGRGFAPFGSDDPMMRPFEKYPVNHHLAQVLERLVAIAALRYGPLIGELGTFNGD